jgi:uncharacterized protein (DUF305 family)
MTRQEFLRTLALGAGAGAAALAGAARAGSDSHAGHPAPANADTPATRAYRAANDRMHTDMAIAFTGDPDIDFARAMIPHHQGAIDMASALLAHGTDPDLLALAEEIIAAQQAEIAFLTDWLARSGG